MSKLVINTKSQNTISAYEHLAANPETAFTIKEVATALGLSSSQVTGGLVSLAKKNVVIRGEKVEGEKTYASYQMNPEMEVEFAFETAKAMSDKSVQVLKALQAQTEDLTAGELAEILEVAPISVNGVVNGLVKRGYVVREEAELEINGETKKIKLLVLTEAGREYQF
jgi:DNA-binding MarR family transcriptional regulator